MCRKSVSEVEGLKPKKDTHSSPMLLGVNKKADCDEFSPMHTNEKFPRPPQDKVTIK